ncbi:MAG: shikimate kinase [Anaerovoracaceae bacterium]|jgi:shikimate kinase
MRIYVIGFMGTDRVSVAREVARKKGYEFRHMDEEIQERDGRTILRMCMTMGEHEYRNKEYEMLREYDQMDDIVVACGEGVVHDKQCSDFLRRGRVVVVREDPDAMWERARQDDSLPYAFLRTGSPEERKRKFMELYQIRKPLYEQFKEEEK